MKQQSFVHKRVAYCTVRFFCAKTNYLIGVITFHLGGQQILFLILYCFKREKMFYYFVYKSFLIVFSREKSGQSW